MSAAVQSPLVSVIVASGVAGDGLRSAMTQSYPNLEILVLDDGSSGRASAAGAASAAVDSLTADDTRIRRIAGADLNRALDEAGGEFVAVIGSDDVWVPAKIERQVRRMVASGKTTGLVYNWWAWLDANGAIVDTSSGWRIEGNAADALVWVNFSGSLGVPLLRRSALLEVGGFDQADGWDVAQRVAERFRVAVVPEVLVGHRLPIGHVGEYAARQWQSCKQVLERAQARRPELPGPLLQASANQFALQLASLAYWSGDRGTALRWLLRTGFRLPVLASPYLVKMVVWSKRPGPKPVVMRPGMALGRVPFPLLPLDKLSVVARMVQSAAKWLVNLPSTVAHWRSLARLRREAKAVGPQQPHVLAYVDSSLPAEGREAAYREILALVQAGSAVRIVADSAVVPLALLPFVRVMSGRTVDVESDFAFYTFWMPNQVYALARELGEVLGLTEEQVVNQNDFHRAMSFARMAEAWAADRVYTAGIQDATAGIQDAEIFGFVAAGLLNVPRVTGANRTAGVPQQAELAAGKLRIALLSFEYPPETGFGGIGTYTWYQARALAKLGHEVHVLAGFTERVAWRTATHDGVTVHRYRPGGAWMLAVRVFGLLGWHWTRQRLENSWTMYQGIKRLGRFDVIEMPECGAEGALINRLLDTPTIVRFHGPSQLIMHFYDPAWVDVKLCSWLEMLGIRTATMLTSCSLFLADEVVQKMGVTQKVLTIQNGIDLPLFDAEPVADLEAIYGIPQGTVTILFAGRMEQRKGIYECPEIVERVLARYPDVVFLFAGQDLFGYMENEMLPRLSAQVARGAVRYLGKLGLQELRACARAVDIYLLPSLWENAPYACLEAMAAGRAVVVSRQGGMPEIIEDGVNGMLGELGEPASFADKLERLIGDPFLRRQMGDAARRTVEERYTDVHVARLSEAVYRATMAGRG